MPALEAMPTPAQHPLALALSLLLLGSPPILAQATSSGGQDSTPVQEPAGSAQDADDKPTGEEEVRARLEAIESILGGDYASAREVLEALLVEHPTHRDALSLLRDHYTSVERWQELAEVLEREVPLVLGPRAQAELHYEIGHIHDQLKG